MMPTLSKIELRLMHAFELAYAALDEPEPPRVAAAVSFASDVLGELDGVAQPQKAEWQQLVELREFLEIVLRWVVHKAIRSRELRPRCCS